MQAHPGPMEVYLGAMKPHPGGSPWGLGLEAHPGPVEAHPGAMESHPGAVEAHLGTFHVQLEP
jgi:hypothetical protein